MLLDFEPADLQALKLQSNQTHADLSLEQGQALAKSHKAVSCWDGRSIIACAGLIEMWPGRAMAWALFSPAIRQYMPEIVKAMRKAVKNSPFHRVEMYLRAPTRSVDIRLAKLLDFEYESVARAFTPDRVDAEVWTWIRPNSHQNKVPLLVPLQLSAAARELILP